MALLWRGVHGTLHVYCGHAALSTWANKHADSDAKHTANWLISCSLVSLCIINEGASREHGEGCCCCAGTEMAHSTRVLVCPERPQPSWALSTAEDWFHPSQPLLAPYLTASVHPPHLLLCKVPRCLWIPWCRGKGAGNVWPFSVPQFWVSGKLCGGGCCYNSHNHSLQRRGAWCLW